ncbi:MAG: ComEA family DNA-binding protein [Dehalococcoidia bacterium]|nr:ComEA family DNA-binding protein [Dehalococcoidia bacterium]
MAEEQVPGEAARRTDQDGRPDHGGRDQDRRWTRWLPSIFLALALLSGVSGTTYWFLDRPSSNTVEITLPTPTALPRPVAHVAGAVAAPGVYTLELDSRVSDAIAAAGGPLPGADVDALNLAARVADGDRIQLAMLPLPERGGDALGAGDVGSGGTDTANGLIDLNTAGQLELETLPNIGPSRAKAIIEWRGNNGPFASLDSLRDVPGIGPETVAGIRGLVTQE